MISRHRHLTAWRKPSVQEINQSCLDQSSGVMPLLGPWIWKIDEDLADAMWAKEVLQGHLRFAMDQADMCQPVLVEASGKMLHPSP
jgi:hypothetical protein